MGKKQKKSNRNGNRKSNRISSGSRVQKAAVYQGVRVNRKYKDSLFRMVFKSREALLSLYNAINKSNYENPEDLEITTIEDVIYIGVKNDVSFLIDSFMNLYEAQSTKNPNMPLRGLIYFAQLYQSYAAQRRLNLYSGSLRMLPTPRYVVLYNGTAPAPETSEYRLSDSFEHKQESTCLECVATVLNMNAGHNEELMKSCRLLYEYAYFVDRVRYYLEQYQGRLEYAVDCAVSECIEADILKGFLIGHRAEVKTVILTEYDAKQHIEAEKSESYLEGQADGEAIGEARILRLMDLMEADGKAEQILRLRKDTEFLKRMYEQYGIDV